MDKLTELPSVKYINCSLCASSETKCANCLKVSYCSKKHQKEDWKAHRPDCFPATEQYNKELGRYLVATKNISPGEKIFEEKPLLSGPTSYHQDAGVSSPNLRPICLGCCQVLSGTFKNWTNVCPGCAWPLCKQDCGKISNHSDFECQIFKDLKLTPFKLFEERLVFNFEMVTVLRMLILKEKDPIKWRKLLALESKEEYRKKVFEEVLDSTMTVAFLLIVSSMWDFCLVETETPAKLIHQLLGILRINKIGSNFPEEFSRYDVFEKTSKLTHSCVSNTFAITYPDNVKKVRAKVEIQKGTILTEFYSVYILNFTGINERRGLLFNNYNFWCTCPRCIDPTEVDSYSSAIKCNAKINGAKCPGFYLPVIQEATGNYDKWQCNNVGCKFLIKYNSKLSKVYLKLEAEISAAKTLADQMKIISKNSNTTVHENHCLLMNLRHTILTAIIRGFLTTPKTNREYRMKLSSTLRDYCNRLLIMADKFFAERSPERGVFLYYYLKSLELESELIQDDQASSFGIKMACFEVIKEAKSILEVVPSDSPAYSSYKEVETKNRIFQELIANFASMQLSNS